MAARIIADTANGILDVKRLKLPGVKVEDDCPKCGSIWQWDGDTDHVNYPDLSDKINLNAYCNKCNNEWEVNVGLQVKITL